MEGAKTVSVGAVYVPNRYRIHLGPVDFERFEGLIPTLRDEFSGLLRRTAVERRWQFPGPLVVTFEEDPGISSGRFEVVAEHDAEATALAAEAGPRDVLRLLGTQPPKQWILAGSRLVVGRLPACEVSLNDQNASRQHAELAHREDGWWIIDLESTNGTFVNGSLVKERRLTPGDRIQIGSSKLEFGLEEPVPHRHPAPDPPVETVPEPVPERMPERGRERIPERSPERGPEPGLDQRRREEAGQPVVFPIDHLDVPPKGPAESNPRNPD